MSKRIQRPAMTGAPATVTAAIVILLAAALSASGCTRAPATAIRFGIMPDADSLPFMVADANGWFEDQGMAVELVPFANAQEREAALQAGAIDGAVSDLLAAAFAAAGGFDLRVTSVTDGRYGLAVAPGSTAAGPADLRGASIGLSTNTIINYAVDAIMEAAGLSPGSYTATAIPKIPVRMEMLLAGQVDAACLPEPLLSAAAVRGARIVATTDAAGVDAGVVVFRKAFLDERLRDVQRLYTAYDRARTAVNADPESFRAFLVEKASFPEEVRDAYRFVTYREPTLPDATQVAAALAWMKAHGRLSVDLDPAAILDGRAVAGW